MYFKILIFYIKNIINSENLKFFDKLDLKKTLLAVIESATYALIFFNVIKKI
jgi:hypothetical protein